MRLITLLILLLFTSHLSAETDSLSSQGFFQNLLIDTTDQLLLNRAESLLGEGDFEEAKKEYQLLLNELLPEFNNEDFSANPSENNLYYSSPLLLKVLLGKADLLERQANPKDKSGISLEPALSVRELTVDALFHLRQNYSGAALAYENQQAGRELEWAAINLAYKLYEKSNNPSYLLRCFRLVEKSKKGALSYALVHPKTYQLANVSPKDLKNLTQKKREVGKLSSDWAAALLKSNNKITELSKVAQDKYIVGRKAYNRKLSEFSKKYHRVFKLRYNESIVTVGEIQNRLQEPDQVFLSYYNTKEYLYGFVITLNGLKAKRMKRPKKLNQKIADFFNLLKNKEEQSNCKVYDALALELYETLIKPFEPLKKQIVIVPDEEIGYLPFNALLYTAPAFSCEFADYPFLLNKYQLSLHYSAEEFAKEVYSKIEGSNRSFMALAPENQSYVKQLTRQLKGKFVQTNNLATEELKKSIDSQAMLLSANELKSYAGAERGQTVLFGTEKTEMGPAEKEGATQLVVLSECEVKPTLNSKGGHIHSLARDLLHFGAKSVLTTLWQLPVTSNESLLPIFFKALKNGKSKTAALQLSNQSYLKKTKTAEAAAPSQWAAYTLIGNADSITERNWYWLLLGIIPVITIGYFWRKRRREKRRKEREVTTTMEY
ncbi:MAG: CHAT domain-containing protein [Patescibacteria group bacterium]|jgi:CHAT domain-containing protein